MKSKKNYKNLIKISLLICTNIIIFGFVFNNEYILSLNDKAIENPSLHNSNTYDYTITVWSNSHYVAAIGYLNLGDQFIVHSFSNTQNTLFDVKLYDYNAYQTYTQGDSNYEEMIYNNQPSSSTPYYGNVDSTNFYYVMFENQDNTDTVLTYSIETIPTSHQPTTPGNVIPFGMYFLIISFISLIIGVIFIKRRVSHSIP